MIVENGSLKATIKRETPRTRMYAQVIFRRMNEWYAELAEEFGVDADVLDMFLSDLGKLATRVEIEGELDFELPSHTDNSEDIRRKSVAYLDTAHLAFIKRVMVAIADMDRPTDVVTAPEPLPEDAPKN